MSWDTGETEVLCLRANDEIVTLKVFPARSFDEYYFHFYPAAGAWDLEEKDSGETVAVSDENVRQLIALAQMALTQEPS